MRRTGETKLYQRGGVWWAWGYDRDGNRWRRSTKQRDKSAARIVAAKLAQDLALEASGPANEASLEDAIGAMIEAAERSGRSKHTIEIMVLKGRHLVRLLGARTKCVGIDLAMTTKYAYARLDEGASKHTVHKEIGKLVQALRRAAKLGMYRPRIDPRGLKPDELAGAYVPRERWLTPEEYRELFAELDPKRTHHERAEDRRDYLAVWCQAGLRDSELYGLRVSHVDFAANELDVQGTKTKGARRRVPMSPVVADILRRRVRVLEKRREKGEDVSAVALFPRWANVNGELAKACHRIERRWNEGLKDVVSPQRKSERVRPAKSFDPVTPNDLRRTFASWLAQAGVPLHHAAKLLGHGSTAMLEKVYARLAPQNMRDAVALLPASVASAPEKPKQLRAGSRKKK